MLFTGNTRHRNTTRRAVPLECKQDKEIYHERTFVKGWCPELKVSGPEFKGLKNNCHFVKKETVFWSSSIS